MNKQIFLIVYNKENRRLSNMFCFDLYKKKTKTQKTIWVHPKQLLAAHSEQLVHGPSAGRADSTTSSLHPAPLAELSCQAREPCGHCACLLPACPQGHAVAIPSSAAHPGTALPAVQCGFAAAFARRVICSGTGVGFGTQHRDHTYYLNTTAKGLEGEKKRERKKTNMKYLLRFGDTHTHVHTTQTHQPGSGSLAVEEGRLWLRLSSKPPRRQSLLKGNPLGQN